MSSGPRRDAHVLSEHEPCYMTKWLLASLPTFTCMVKEMCECHLRQLYIALACVSLGVSTLATGAQC